MTTLQQARAAADKGINSSAQHAENDVPGWGDRALTMTRWFARIKGPKCCKTPNGYELVPDSSEPFTMEEVRIWATAHDLPSPPDARAWGSVTRRALSEGLIVATGGYRATAASNGAARATYRKA